jgi:hypothetical protein
MPCRDAGNTDDRDCDGPDAGLFGFAVLAAFIGYVVYVVYAAFVVHPLRYRGRQCAGDSN